MTTSGLCAEVECILHERNGLSFRRLRMGWLKRFLRQRLPGPYRRCYDVYHRMIDFVRFVSCLGRGKLCVFCGRASRRFLSHGLDSPVFREKQIIGAGYRLNAGCPFCGCLDRERHVYLYLKEKTEIFAKPLRMLHVAPEANLGRLLRQHSNIDYLSADLDPTVAMIRMDLMDIEFPENTFDAIICNHVLEHVPDDRRGMAELFRVLKPGGWAILQVPISLALEMTFEDPRVTSPAERERLFGQNDHVRLHGRDYERRLQHAGFAVELYRYVDERGEEAADRYCLIGQERLYIGRKLPPAVSAN